VVICYRADGLQEFVPIFHSVDKAVHGVAAAACYNTMDFGLSGCGIRKVQAERIKKRRFCVCG